MSTEPMTEKDIDDRCTCWSPDGGHDGDCAVWTTPVAMGKGLQRKRSDGVADACTCWPAGSTGHDPECAVWRL